MKVVDSKSSNRQHTDTQEQRFSHEHSNHEHSVKDCTAQNSSANESLEHISALKQLCQHAENIILHMDGSHGVGRKYSSQEELVARAAKEVYLVLDLGHVLRLYFGDDYFDVILSSKIVQQRKPEINRLVQQIQIER